MPFGPGKYGANAEALLKHIDADMVIIIVVGGPKGESFDIATRRPELLESIPRVIRGTAKEIEKIWDGSSPSSH
jgi:hypothetical protein